MELPKSLIDSLKRRLPALCSVSDLRKLGIYRSDQAAYAARKSGSCPEHFYFPSRGYVYPREAVIEFLKKTAKISSRRESKIKDAIISHSKAPPLKQK